MAYHRDNAACSGFGEYFAFLASRYRTVIGDGDCGLNSIAYIQVSYVHSISSFKVLMIL
jgi:hypothetical protein